MTVTHKYLKGNDGNPLKFDFELQEKCVMCSSRGADSNMALYQRGRVSETVHCLTCDHQENRPIQRTGPMNSGS